ncbi:hypothetical protein BH23ACT3_BH23ACT3_17390 [soil metagenome]
MFIIARRRVGLTLAAGLVIASAVGVTSMTSAQDQVVTAPPSVPYGTITLDLTDRAGPLTFRRVGGDTFTQALSVATPCSTLVAGPVVDDSGNASSSGTTLLSFSATVASGSDPNVQLPGSGLGVTDGANCGVPAGLFGPGETLSVELGDFYDTDVRIGSGSLNIGKSHPRDGSLRVAYDSEAFGSSISIANGGQVVPVGPDFTAITLRSTATQSSRGLSLEGQTVFNLVTPSNFDAALGCSDSYPAPQPGDAATSATFIRAENGDEKGTAPCKAIGVTVDIRETVVFWNNDAAGGTQDVRALVEIEWAGVAPSKANGRTTEINYDGDEAGPFFEAQWCESFTDSSTGTEIRVNAELPEGPIGTDDGTPTGELINGIVPWCLVSSTDELKRTGTDEEGRPIFEVVRTTVFYGAGDPVGRWS